MVNVGSLPQQANVVFDLDTHAGVMHLLASIRASELSTVQKNELRDLVFLYSNGGKDQSVRLSLEQKINTYRVTPLPVKEPEKPLPPPPAIGKFRVAPSFSVPQSQTAPVAPPQTSQIPTFTAPAAWQPPAPAVPEEALLPVDQSVPVAPPEVEVSVAPVVEDIAPTAVATPVPVVESVPEVVVPQPAPAPVAPIAAAPVVPVDDQQYLQRIREIKALVNEKVGNPVNLVDINSEVGREYMGALLDAMKKLNSGSPAISAMQRLEDAYAAVEKILSDGPSSAPAQSSPVPVPPLETRDSEPMPEMRAQMESPVIDSTPVPPPSRPTPVPEPQPIIESEPVPIRRVVDPLPGPAPVTVTENAPFQSASPFPQTKDVPPPASNPVPVTRVPEYHEVAAPASSPFASLADLSKPTTPAAVPIASSLKVAAETAGDPLFTPEVDEGLQQLLVEWSIFKKSGLFGTGPKGREHPLFKKMAALHIPLILAGRFEGATQEIKQSVTDYMNGWRYEQGLIYQQGETFEHYLRRVIRHILDMQRG